MKDLIIVFIVLGIIDLFLMISMYWFDILKDHLTIQLIIGLILFIIGFLLVLYFRVEE